MWVIKKGFQRCDKFSALTGVVLLNDSQLIAEAYDLSSRALSLAPNYNEIMGAHGYIGALTGRFNDALRGANRIFHDQSNLTDPLGDGLQLWPAPRSRIGPPISPPALTSHTRGQTRRASLGQGLLRRLGKHTLGILSASASTSSHQNGRALHNGSISLHVNRGPLSRCPSNNLEAVFTHKHCVL